MEQGGKDRRAWNQNIQRFIINQNKKEKQSKSRKRIDSKIRYNKR